MGEKVAVRVSLHQVSNLLESALALVSIAVDFDELLRVVVDLVADRVAWTQQPRTSQQPCAGL